MPLKKRPVKHIKKLTKTFVRDTIALFKRQAGIRSNKYSQDNIDKMDEWFLHGNYDPKGVEGQVRIMLINEFAHFVTQTGTFSIDEFIDSEFNELCLECYRVLDRCGYHEYKDLIEDVH